MNSTRNCKSSLRSMLTVRGSLKAPKNSITSTEYFDKSYYLPKPNKPKDSSLNTTQVILTLIEVGKRDATFV